MLSQVGIFALPFLAKGAYAAFGLTDADGAYTVDTGGSLVYSVDQASCDINSILHGSDQLQYASQGSHISSGLGSASVSATQDGMLILANRIFWVSVQC
jgi:rhamnogalacturonan endolyase